MVLTWPKVFPDQTRVKSKRQTVGILEGHCVREVRDKRRNKRKNGKA